MAYRGEPEGVLAVVEAPAAGASARREPATSSRSGSRSPGNLGAMARSAEAAGADALVVADALADVWNPNAIRASTGAVFTLPVVEATLEDVRGARGRSSSLRSSAPRRRYTEADLAAPDGDRRRRRGRRPRARLARGSRARGLDPDAQQPRPTASTRRPRPRSCSSRRCASVVERDDVLRARADDRAPPRPDADALVAHARRPPQVRALPAHRLVQVARRAEQARSSLTGRGEAARRDRDLGREPRPGGRLRRRRVRRRRARRDVAGRLGAEDRRDPRLRRRRSTSRPTAPPEAFARLDVLMAQTGRDARPPVRRPGRDRRRRHGRASRSRRTRPTRTP